MKKNLFCIVIVSLILSACTQVLDLPGNGNEGTEGISNDEFKYVEITPRWQFNDLGLSWPTDVYAARDGRLYIADSASASIRVIRRSGEVENGLYDTLENISVNGRNIKPASVCIDSRFLVYFTDKGDKVYAWNQFASLTGIKGIVQSREYISGDSIVTLTPLEGLAQKLSPVPDSDVTDTLSLGIDSLSRPFVIYDPASDDNKNGIFDPVSGENMPGNSIYAQINKSLTALADGGEKNLFFYVMDGINNQLLKVRLVPSEMVKLDNGQLIWFYKGILDRFVATAGTGAGTVSEPTGLYTDESGNCYYTQTGDYFSFHKLLAGSYISPYLINEDDIMRLGEFGCARDVTTGDGGHIFILDTLDRDVKMYNAHGEFMKSVVVSEEWIRQTDSSYVNDSLVVSDTLLLQQTMDLLKNPMAVIYYDDVLYTLDNGNGRILRFTKADDVIIDDPDPDN